MVSMFVFSFLFSLCFFIVIITIPTTFLSFSFLSVLHDYNKGIVTEDTKITFRSRSARIIWLVQISSEMYEYASPYESSKRCHSEISKRNERICEIYFDKFISFIHRLFEKWKDLEVSHSLTVIFFSRTFLLSKKRSNNWNHTNATDKSAASAVKEDVYGRLYEVTVFVG